MSSQPVIRNISDTARWAAAFRAMESTRPDALFRDPLAERLAGARGREAVERMPSRDRHAWAWVTRTWCFDRLLEECLADGADGVLNLAAGLDARPFRIDVRPSVHWFEVDLPEIIEYKQDLLRNERPRCRLERVALDLSDRAARQELFSRVGQMAQNVVVLTEGLLIYLAPQAVADLADDLAGQPAMRAWITEIVSPVLLRMLQKRIGRPLGDAGAPLKFGPAEGPAFFASHGWREKRLMAMLPTAARLRRLPWMMRLMALLPDRPATRSRRPWSGVCSLERDSVTK